MKVVYLVFVLCLWQLCIQAQDTTSRMKLYKLVVFEGLSKMTSGNLASFNDTSMLLAGKASSVLHPQPGQQYMRFDYSTVNKIHVTRKGAVGRGALTGTLVGIGVGVLAGLIEGDDPPCTTSEQDFFAIGYTLCSAFRLTAGDKAAIYGTGGAISGAIIGIAVGAVAHKKFIIGKRKENFKHMQLTMLERLYVKRNP